MYQLLLYESTKNTMIHISNKMSKKRMSSSLGHAHETHPTKIPKGNSTISYDYEEIRRFNDGNCVLIDITPISITNPGDSVVGCVQLARTENGAAPKDMLPKTTKEEMARLNISPEWYDDGYLKGKENQSVGETKPQTKQIKREISATATSSCEEKNQPEDHSLAMGAPNIPGHLQPRALQLQDKRFTCLLDDATSRMQEERNEEQENHDNPTLSTPTTMEAPSDHRRLLFPKTCDYLEEGVVRHWCGSSPWPSLPTWTPLRKIILGQEIVAMVEDLGSRYQIWGRVSIHYYYTTHFKDKFDKEQFLMFLVCQAINLSRLAHEKPCNLPTRDLVTKLKQRCPAASLWGVVDSPTFDQFGGPQFTPENYDTREMLLLLWDRLCHLVAISRCIVNNLHSNRLYQLAEERIPMAYRVFDIPVTQYRVDEWSNSQQHEETRIHVNRNEDRSAILSNESITHDCDDHRSLAFHRDVDDYLEKGVVCHWRHWREGSPWPLLPVWTPDLRKYLGDSIVALVEDLGAEDQTWGRVSIHYYYATHFLLGKFHDDQFLMFLACQAINRSSLARMKPSSVPTSDLVNELKVRLPSSSLQEFIFSPIFDEPREPGFTPENSDTRKVLTLLWGQLCHMIAITRGIVIELDSDRLQETARDRLRRAYNEFDI